MKKGGLLILLTGTLFTTSGELSGLGLGGYPIDLSGSLGLRFRSILPDSGEETFQQAYTGEILASSYIWEPWYANWKGRVSASWERNESSKTTENAIFSGAGELNLFHLSRFPLTAYIDVKDSRVDDSDLVDPGTDERFSRYGIRQSYTPLSGNMNFNLNIFHDERENFKTGDIEKSTRGIFSGFYNRGHHRVNLSLLGNDRERSLIMDRHKDWQSDITHTYTPGSRFSLTTNLGASRSDSQDSLGYTSTSQERLSSSFLWRSEELPINVRGDLFAKNQSTESDMRGDRDENEVRTNLSATYLPNDNWRLRTSIGGRFRTGDVDEQRQFQTISGDYSSDSYPLGLFTYSYGAGIGIVNESNSNIEDEQITRGNFSHNLNRTWQHDWFGSVGASLTLGQDLTYESSTLEDELGTMVHRMSYSLSATGESRSTNINFVVYDSRNTGRNDFTSQNASISAIHNQRMSRYSDFGLSYNVNYTRQSGNISTIIEDDPFTDRDESDIESNEYTSLEIFFHQNRLFKVRSLRFSTRFRTSSTSLLFDDLSTEPSSELFWENRVDYTVGKLDVDFRTTWVERPAVKDAGTKTITLNIRRLF